jgi:hypothetical protein
MLTVAEDRLILRPDQGEAHDATIAAPDDRLRRAAGAGGVA